MKVDEKTAKFKSEYQEKNYYFCAPGCKKAFDNNPEKYLKKIEDDRPTRHGCC
jgi:YHS domain-containing protein